MIAGNAKPWGLSIVLFLHADSLKVPTCYVFNSTPVRAQVKCLNVTNRCDNMERVDRLLLGGHIMQT